MKTNGFTLVELMVTVAVAAILLTVAIPGFDALMQEQRAATQSNHLLTALNLARSEAVKRGARVSACPSSNGTACSGSDWTVGWMVYTDTATTDTTSTVGEVLRVWSAPRGIETLSGASHVRYRGSGELLNADPVNLTLKPKGCSGQRARNIRIGLTGQAGVQGKQSC
ncbi:GspH/FimT family pseudopilin [Thiorhodospira sibirica]|uniref:GspH/FimT family pseudopilin n=1 Tax=Thiorhodospira sibirica TaxID=154347 RepID=UPI00022C1168|nr:GspH/FimT family pseudopilin [Thiorhodospira sibirica]